MSPTARSCAIALAFSLPFVLGLVLPEAFWATSAIHFLSTGVAAALVLGAGLLIVATLWDGPVRRYLADLGSSRGAWWAALAVAGLSAACLYANPIVWDVWGDAVAFIRAFEGNERAELSQTQHLELFLSPDIFHPKVGERTILNGIALLGDDYIATFRVVDAVCGGLFALLAAKNSKPLFVRSG